MNTTAPIEMETRLSRLEWQNRFLILLLLGVAAIGSIAATNRHSEEIRTDHLTIVDNHGKVLWDEQGVEGEVYIRRYATIQTTDP